MMTGDHKRCTMWVSTQEGRSCGQVQRWNPPSLEKKTNKKLNSLLKWHTATSAGYFSPYTFTLNMINKGTHWERRKKDDNKSTVL